MTSLPVTPAAALALPDAVATVVTGSATLRVLAPFDARTVPIAAGWIPTVDEDTAARLWDRAGVPRGGTDTFRFDYGSLSARTLLSDEVLLRLSEAGFAGYSLGSILGGAGELGYDPDAYPLEDRGHVPHGGDHRTRGIRALLQSISGPVVTDGTQEHLADLPDLAQDSDGLYPGHMLMAEETVRALGMLDVPNDARDMSPPVWATVYGERSQTGRLMPPLTTVGREDSLYHPDGGDTGLTSTEWNQLFAWQAATLAIHGHLPMLQVTARRFTDRVRPDTDEPIVAFLGTLFQALTDTDWCAQYLAFGRHEMPLPCGREVNSECNRECGGARDTTTNPVAATSRIAAAVYADAVPPLLDSLGASAAASFPVPSVLHTVRRNREDGTLCLLLVNWTATPALWNGSFRPWLYPGFGGRVNRECSSECDRLELYDVVRLNSDGTMTSMATDLDDSTLLTTSGTAGTISGTTLSLGSVPAYSLQAYRISIAG